MKYLTLLTAFYSLSTLSATITTNPDQLFTPSPGCTSLELAKKTVLLVDQTVDNKEALVSAIKGLEYKISSFYSSDNKDYLLNHKFEYSSIDDSGEHSAEWIVQTSKNFGNHSQKLQESLTELNSNIENSLKKIKQDKKSYQSTMLLEQILSYAKGLEKCDNLIVISDLLLVDKDGNNFEKGIFSAPTSIGETKGKIALLRIEKNGQHLKDIKKVEAWWNQSLNGGVAFSNVYSLKKAANLKRQIAIESKVVSLEDTPETVEADIGDHVSDQRSSIEKTEFVEPKPLITKVEPLDLNFESPPEEMDIPSISKNEKVLQEVKPLMLPKSDESDDEEDELAYDDFSDLGIDMNQLYGEAPKKKDKKEVSEIPLAPVKKEVDAKFLQLSCDEFTGRLTREAFPICNIDLQEIKNSRIEITLNQDGRISNYDNSFNLPLNKKTCLSGYVASRPAIGVGTDFTCRVLIQ